MSSTIRFPEKAVQGGRIGTARVRTSLDDLARSGGGAVAAALDALTSAGATKASKYRNRACVVDGITFDSEREGERYRVLARRRDAGEIVNLRIQVPFVIVPAVTIGGKRQRQRVYIADFVYDYPAGGMVVEDVKGMRTAVYTLKRQLMKVVHNIEIQEV